MLLVHTRHLLEVRRGGEEGTVNTTTCTPLLTHHLHTTTTTTTHHPPPPTTKMMTVMDADRSGTVRSAEFITGLQSMDVVLNRTQYLQLFRAVDVTNDNSVTIDELRVRLGQEGTINDPTQKTATAEEMFQAKVAVQMEAARAQQGPEEAFPTPGCMASQGGGTGKQTEEENQELLRWLRGQLTRRGRRGTACVPASV